MSRPQGRSRWVTIAIVALAALVIAPAAVWASHTFTDVDDDNTFHTDIEAIAEARVTIGCNPPENTEYCPDDFVTREQMAAFMNRLGALDDAKEPVVNARAVQGLGLYSDTLIVEVDNADEDWRECEPTESMLGSDVEYGTFFTSYQLLSVPDATGFSTVDVAVATSGEDLNGDTPDSGFFVCFAHNDVAAELPDGEYTLYRLESHHVGAVSDGTSE
jgi:hypothetical protein